MPLLVFVFTGISDVATVLGSLILVWFRSFQFRPFEPRFLEIGLWPAPKSTPFGILSFPQFYPEATGVALPLSDHSCGAI